MNKELSLSMKKLNRENRRIIRKMELYLESRYINEFAGEEILSDIVGMALECQKRGESFSDAIGGDSETFCRELIRNSPRQSVLERVLVVLIWLLFFTMFLVPGLYLIEWSFPGLNHSSAQIEGFLYTVRLSFLLKSEILIILLVIGWFLVKRNTYRPMKYVVGLYVAVPMAAFLIPDTILNFNTPVTISLPIYVGVVFALLCLAYLGRKLTALTIAYQKKKHSQIQKDRTE